VNILRSAAATNQVRLHVRHFFPSNSSNEYQKLLFDEKSTDDDDNDMIHRILNFSQNRNNQNTNDVRMRRPSGRHQQLRHSTYSFPFGNGDNQEKQNINDRSLRGLDVSDDALQSLLNSKFKLIDLVDLLKKIYPKLLNDQKIEFQYIQQLSQSNTGKILFLFFSE
jgi:hypothetical protein